MCSFCGAGSWDWKEGRKPSTETESNRFQPQACMGTQSLGPGGEATDSRVGENVCQSGIKLQYI